MPSLQSDSDYFCEPFSHLAHDGKHFDTEEEFNSDFSSIPNLTEESEDEMVYNLYRARQNVSSINLSSEASFFGIPQCIK